MKSASMIHQWLFAAAVCACAIGMAGASRGAVIAYDDLEDAAVGSLGGQASGTGFTAAYVLGGGSAATVGNQSLSYSSGDITVSGGTNCIVISYPNSTAFTRAIDKQNGDTLYVSFLFNTPTADGGSNEDFCSFGFANAVSEPSAGVMHRYSSPSGDHAFGVRTSLNTDVKGSLGTEPNRTYFVVLRMRKLVPGAGQNFNELSLFVDPDSMYEPAPTLVVTNTGWAAASHIAARIASSDTGDTYYLDNLCIGDTYSSVVYPTGNSPVTEQPVITPRSGTYSGALTVAITDPTPGATIYYTTDGSTPSPTHGTVYTGPFTQSASACVQAIAISDGKANSAITSLEYKIRSLWLGAGADNNWSTATNWNPAASPADGDLVFGSVDRTTSTVVNNIVDSSTTVSSIAFTNTTRVAATPSSATWHVTQIDSDKVLTVNGSTTFEDAVLIGGIYATGEHGTYVKMTGGGGFVVDAETSNFLCANTSDNNRGDATFDLAGLSDFQADVARFWVGRGSRTQAIFILPSTGVGTSTIRAPQVAVGDGYGAGEANGLSEIRFGQTTELNTDTLLVGAATAPLRNVQGGKLSFQSNLSGATAFIRGLNGGAVETVVVGSHGGASNADKTVRGVSGTLDFTGGTIDAKFGSMTVGEARGYWASSGGIGTVNGTVSMAAGVIEAGTVVLGRSTPNNSTDTRNGLATGKLTVTGGRFRAETISLAHNVPSANQTTVGRLAISDSGHVEVLGDICMGTRAGTAAVVTSRVEVVGGMLEVGGNMIPDNASANIVSEVLLSGGSLFVTNAAETATLRIENGMFVISGGTALLDRLVTTNALTTTTVTLRGVGSEDFGHVSVNEDVALGGTLNVVLDGYEIHGGESWTIVSGTGTRTGTFAAISPDLPENMKIVYTSNGYKLICPARGTVLEIR